MNSGFKEPTSATRKIHKARIQTGEQETQDGVKLENNGVDVVINNAISISPNATRCSQRIKKDNNVDNCHTTTDNTDNVLGIDAIIEQLRTEVAVKLETQFVGIETFLTVARPHIKKLMGEKKQLEDELGLKNVFLRGRQKQIDRYEGALMRIRDYPDDMEAAKMKRKFIAEDALEGKGDIEGLVKRAENAEAKTKITLNGIKPDRIQSAVTEYEDVWMGYQNMLNEVKAERNAMREAISQVISSVQKAFDNHTSTADTLFDAVDSALAVLRQAIETRKVGSDEG